MPQTTTPQPLRFTGDPREKVERNTRMAEQYRADVSMHAIAKAEGVTPERVRVILMRMGVHVPTPRTTTP